MPNKEEKISFCLDNLPKESRIEPFLAFKKSNTNEPINTRVFGDLVFVKLSWKFAAADRPIML